VRRFLWLVVVLMIGLLLVAGCGGSAPAPTEPAGDGSGEQTEPVEKPKIIVGSKNFTEQLIAGEMVALLFEDAGYPVERKMRLGGTGLVHESLVNGEINVYVEYTGTGLTALLKEEPMFDPQAVYDREITQIIFKINKIKSRYAAVCGKTGNSINISFF
jgi:osmoprotectant transport system substrate-binding protein